MSEITAQRSIREVDADIKLVFAFIEDQGKALDALRDRVERLERERPKVKVPSLDDQILDFLARMPGIWFNPTSIAENLGVSNGNVADRLSRHLHPDGLVETKKESGKRPLYRHKEAQ